MKRRSVSGPAKKPPPDRPSRDVPASRVNIRELRQNLSKYLVRVKAGEIIEVAERGEPVATLQPLGKSMSALDRLLAEGKLLAPTQRFEDLGPPLPAGMGPTLSEILEEMRSEDE